MHFAAFSGNVELVDNLHERGLDVNAHAWESSYIVPLLSGTLVRRYGALKRLLELGDATTP